MKRAAALFCCALGACTPSAPTSLSATKTTKATATTTPTTPPPIPTPLPLHPGPVERAAVALGEGVLVAASPRCSATDGINAAIALVEADVPGVAYATVEVSPGDIPPPFRSAVPWTFVVKGGRLVDGVAGALPLPDGPRLFHPRILNLLVRNDLAPASLARPRKRLRAEAFDGGSFGGFDVAGVDLAGRDLKDADFAGADLTGADLRNADLRGALFMNADLRGAHLDGARLDGAAWYRTFCPDGSRSSAAGEACDVDGARRD